MLITFLNKSVINDSKALLNSDFEMNDLAATKKIFAMKIWRDQNSGKILSQYT